LGITVSAICLIDTTVLCELLRVPGRCQEVEQVRSDFDRRKAASEQLFLPLATLIETGNHIGQVKDPAERGRVVEEFVRIVRDAIDRGEPFHLCRLPERGDVARWLNDLPQWCQTRRSGLGDLSIKVDWDRLCGMNRKRRVYVWSLDVDLGGFDTGA
jgi:hypothetical protein